MCGIVGIVRFDGRPVRLAEIEAMTGQIRHRGPDDHGALVNEGDSVAVVFNGEIYNHRDVRSRLEIDGHVFRGTSDTEVLVHGYEQLGIAELTSRLEGMFAFALVDRRRRRLFLVRDRFGIKPLYLRRTSRQISFASELRALNH